MKKTTQTSKKAEKSIKKLGDIFIKLAEKELELAKIVRWTEEVKDVKDPSEDLIRTAKRKEKRVRKHTAEITGLGEQVQDLQQIYNDMVSKFDLKPKVPSYIK